MYEFTFGSDVVTLTAKFGVFVHFIGSIKSVQGLSDIHYIGDREYTSKTASTIDLVSCDIVENGLVGDTTAPLLRAIPVAGKNDFCVIGSCKSPPYIELQKLTLAQPKLRFVMILVER